MQAATVSQPIQDREAAISPPNLAAETGGGTSMAPKAPLFHLRMSDKVLHQMQRGGSRG